MKRLWWVAGAVALVAAGLAGGYLARLPQANAGWIPVIAALGASVLTTVALVSVEFLRQHDARAGGAQEKKREAYSRFLAESASFITLASEVHTLRKLGTGVRASVRIGDGLAFIQRFNRDIEPLLHAWSSVWLSGSAEAITATNRLIDATTPAMSMASAKGAALPALVANFLGERWTDQQERDFHEALRQVALRRKDFGEIARKEMGEPAGDLFAGIPGTDSADVAKRVHDTPDTKA